MFWAQGYWDLKFQAGYKVELFLSMITARYFDHWQRNFKAKYKASNTSNQARAYMFGMVLNPLDRWYLNHDFPVLHKMNENEKKSEYNQQIFQEGHGSFSSIVFSYFGGTEGNVAVSFCIMLSVLLTEEKNLKIRSD